MKLKRIRKNAVMMLSYGCSKKKFRNIVRSSPDDNIKRIPARQLARVIKEVIFILKQPIWIDPRGRKYY